MKNITKTEFDNLLKEDTLILADFSATWCGPCQMMAPVMEEIEEEFKADPKVKIVKVDIDEEPELSAKYNVMSVPTFLYLKGDKVIETHTGAIAKDIIVNKIKQLS